MTVATPETKSKKEIILRVTGLTKNFGTLTAVKDLNLELYRGEVFGFLGPNGAGKSTTVGMILGLVAPTHGKIELFGHNLHVHTWSALRKVGAIIEEPAFYPYLSGRDNLEVLSRSIGGITKKKISEVLDRVNLLDRAGDRYDHYSMGMKQRLGIASTLLRDPELIILDEPTSGLDPAGTKEVRDLIPQLAHENRAVFLCSHILHEVELVCHRIAIIKKGTLLANAPIGELLAHGQRLQLQVDNKLRAMEILRQLPFVKGVIEDNGYLKVETAVENAPKINRLLVEAGIQVSELCRSGENLEDVFLQMTGGENGG
ncbi:MAG TPA: ABC transporter ATP-binding protein [Dehalococcoidales bacterium]|nr:ABC transporter ATP-binding protein [Dehalococcoidales bacterium]